MHVCFPRFGGSQAETGSCFPKVAIKSAILVIGVLFAGCAVASHFAGLGIAGIVSFSVASSVSAGVFVVLCLRSYSSSLKKEVASKAYISTQGQLPYNEFIDKEYPRREDLLSVKAKFADIQRGNPRKFAVLWGCAEVEYDDVLHEPKEEKEDFVEFRVGWQDTANHWKIHISVDKDDLPKAWDLIFPILCEQAYVFKVVKLCCLQKKVDDIDAELKLTDAERKERIKAEMREPRKRASESIVELETELEELERLDSSKGLDLRLLLRKMYIPELIKEWKEVEINFITREEEPLKTREHLAKVKESMLRLLNGLQVTVYIPRRQESEHAKLVKDIEYRLSSNEIRRGQIYKTDKLKGKYCSIRHPGKDVYIPGVEATSYNPDNLPEPFEDLQKRESTRPCTFLGGIFFNNSTKKCTKSS